MIIFLYSFQLGTRVFHSGCKITKKISHTQVYARFFGIFLNLGRHNVPFSTQGIGLAQLLEAIRMRLELDSNTR